MDVVIWARIAVLLAVMAGCSSVSAGDTRTDPHYTEAGFFDLHVCNWPDRKPFFLAVFSSTHYTQVDRVEAFQPNGSSLSRFDLQRYHVTPTPGKPEKRVYLNQWPIPALATGGWYTAHIHLKDGRELVARDFVRLQTLGRATHLVPEDKSVDIAAPTELRWDRVPGARFYRVFIRDTWDDDKTIFKSKLLTEPRATLPEGLLQAGGAYSWRVHARDIDGDPITGDFNHGSLTRYLEFSVAP